MTSFTTRIASVAALALAALPIASLATGAHAAEARVQVADLNLASTAGQSVLQQRISVAAHQFCADQRTLSGLSACRAGIRAEAMEKVAFVQQAQAARTTVVAAR